MKEKVRPLYFRLQGYLTQAPAITNNRPHMDANPMCDLVNATLDQLQTITGVDYSLHKYSSELESGYGEGLVIDVTAFRGRLGGIIAELHGMYFADEAAPFSGMPSMVFNQSLNQNQSIQISIVLEMQKKILEAKGKAKDEKETGFLQKLEDSLPAIKNVAELMTTLIGTAQAYGISIDRLKDLFNIG